MTTHEGDPAPLLLLNDHLKSPECHPFLQGEICLFSSPSPLKTLGEANEDCGAAVAVDGNHGMLCVADGVGGMPGGKHASRVAVQELVQAVRNGGESGAALRESVLRGFDAATVGLAGRGSGAATTLAAVEFSDGTLRTYHVGDSEILILSNGGHLKWKTLAHSPVGYRIAAGELDPRDAMFHDERHLVSNVIGEIPTSIEISSPIELTPGDTILAASDGLFDNLYLEELAEALMMRSLMDCTERLVDEVQRRMTTIQQGPSKPDDLTLVIYRHHGK